MARPTESFEQGFREYGDLYTIKNPLYGNEIVVSHPELTVDRERQLIIKTTERRLEALRTRLHQLHPYDVPEFLVIPVTQGSPQYLQWLASNTAVEQ